MKTRLKPFEQAEVKGSLEARRGSSCSVSEIGKMTGNTAGS